MKSFIIAFVLISFMAINAENSFEIDWSRVKPRYVTPKIENDSVTKIDRVQTRIVGGKPARPHQFPYQVGLISRINGGLSWCGGSLISKNYVLTAAHCIYGATEGIVLLGAHNTRNSYESGQVRMHLSTSNYKVHAAFDPQWVRNDIALIKLPKPAELSSKIQLIALPKADIKTEGRTAIASGWGIISDSGTTVNELRYVTLNTISLQRCTIYFRSLIRKTHICADASAGKTTCQGDSGGPLVVEENGVKTLMGLTSFGSSQGCQSGWPSVYTKVSSYLNWIKAHSDVEL